MFDEDDLGADFARTSEVTAATEPVKRYLHASMANEAAVAEILALWAHWKTGRRMRRGFGAFTNLFNQLHAVRHWAPIDRVRTTGLADRIADAVAAGQPDVPIHVELWYRQSDALRQATQQQIAQLVEEMGGQVLGGADRSQIGYHAVAASVPVDSLEALVDLSDQSLGSISLLQSPGVLYIRPGGQDAGAVLEDGLPESTVDTPEIPNGAPRLAVLDGLPATNHPLLQGRLAVVDPDDLSSDPTYTVERRRHGTMVSSAVIWGDLGVTRPATPRLVAIRPILRPDPETRDHSETIPWGTLPPDETIRAVRDLVGPDGAMPSVKVVNLSVGDPLAQFDTAPSAWARAIDWLAYEYGLLFVISAGNHLGNLPMSADDLDALEGVDRATATGAVLAGLASQRRLLTPAESLNALTIGALHSDDAGDSFALGYRVNPWDADADRPSPASAHGRGIRRAVKPDLAAPGGRLLYTRRPGGTEIEPARGSAQAPGVQVAAPPDRVAFVSGTTFAAAEVSRRAVEIMDALTEGVRPVEEDLLAVAAKALLVHSTTPQGRDLPYDAERQLGHGPARRDLSLGCAEHEATLLFTGWIAARQWVPIEVPLPVEVASLSSVRRVSMSLAWLSPINWNHRQYRRAKLWVDGPVEVPGRLRTSLGLAHPLTMRGSVQHRVFETDRVLTADHMTLTVKCADQAGGLPDLVPWALAVTVEAGAEVGVAVYDLVREIVEARVRVQP